MESPKIHKNKTRKGAPVNGHPGEHGFTLIELSIVLVIIGLIVGGILVGQDLIKAAEIRATVAQVEKYNSAVNTFRTKYNAIPGDISATQANSFGLFSETGLPGTVGHQDGNGLVEGCSAGNPSGCGETLYFWRHLSDANLIDGQFGTSGNSLLTAAGALTGAVTVPGQSLPSSKMSPPGYFIVYSFSGLNWFELAPVSGIPAGGVYTFNTVGLTPIQAYNIDIKLDDGAPNTGIVRAMPLAFPTIISAPSWAGTSTSSDCVMGSAGGNNATDPTDTYNRIPTSGGNDGSCALRFRFN